MFLLSGYGIFVWPAFIFTFVSCLVLFMKTKRDLQRLEKKFLSEFGKLKDEKDITSREEKIAKEVLSGSSV